MTTGRINQIAFHNRGSLLKAECPLAAQRIYPHTTASGVRGQTFEAGCSCGRPQPKQYRPLRGCFLSESKIPRDGLVSVTIVAVHLSMLSAGLAFHIQTNGVACSQQGQRVTFGGGPFAVLKECTTRYRVCQAHSEKGFLAGLTPQGARPSNAFLFPRPGTLGLQPKACTVS